MNMDTILKSLSKKLKAKEITIREAAIKLHKAGFTNFIDEDGTKRLLNLIDEWDEEDDYRYNKLKP